MRIFIICADPRDNANLPERAKKLFRPNERPSCLCLYGATVILAHPKFFHNEFQTLLNQIRFHAKRILAEDEDLEIVLVGHDCGFYINLPNRFSHVSAKKRDLPRGAKNLQKYIRQAQVSTWFYVGDEEGEPIFEEIIDEQTVPA